MTFDIRTLVAATFALAALATPASAQSFSSDQRGEIYLKVVNSIGSAQTVQVDLAGAAKVAAEGKAIVLSSARKEDTNTIADYVDRHGYFEPHRKGQNSGWAVMNAQTYADRSALRNRESVAASSKSNASEPIWRSSVAAARRAV